MKALLIPFVALAGALTALEAGCNAKLTQTLGGPWWAALIFAVTTLGVLAAGALAFGGPFPAARFAPVPWWAWTGGAISALYVLAMLVAPTALGSGVFTGVTVTAAVLASIALDHFGLVGFQQHSAGLGRLVGAALMVAGLACVSLF